MFTRLEIKKFRSCQGVTLENIGPLLALIGRNGAGKTNVTRAFEQIASAASSVVLNPRQWEPLHITADVALGDTSYRYVVQSDRKRWERTGDIKESVSIRTATGDFQILFTRQNEEFDFHAEDGSRQLIKIGDSISAMQAATSILPIDNQLSVKIRPLLDFLRHVRYAPLVEPVECDDTEVVLGDTFSAWETEHESVGPEPNDQIIHTLLYLRNRRPEVLDEIKELLGKNGLGLIQDIILNDVKAPPTKQLPEGLSYHWLRFVPSGCDSGFAFVDLSLGTRRIIRLILQLTAQKNSTLLLEHPEDGIHRGLLRKVMDVVKSYCDPLQVILTSHSPYVLNALSPDSLRLVFFNHGRTIVRPLSDSEVSAATEYLEKQGNLDEFIELLEDEDEP